MEDIKVVDAGSDAARRVLLVGYEDEENLGLRYVAAHLREKGVEVGIEPFPGSDFGGLAERIRKDNPVLVGFSIIFQRMLPDFGRAMAFLREQGVTAHFTCGGHFPTMEAERTLEAIPELDSVVRHEGEITLLELCLAVDRPETWREIPGLVYRGDGHIETNPPRPLIEDLDSLPFPARDRPPLRLRGLGIGSLVSSRGCFFDCSFCSVQTFYRGAPGPRRRTRSPGNVVKEMRQLFDDWGVRVFIFKDDDFGTKGRRQGEWIEEFARELGETGLADHILFRVSCRVDEFARKRLARLREVGLVGIYLGIESGNENGLKVFNKHYAVDDVHRALEKLEELDIPFEFGFMIFEPQSTFDRIAEDIRFLKAVGRTGRAVVDFTKMFPYAGTAIAAELREQGRLKGSLGAPDYDYEDSRLSLLQDFFSHAFHHRNFEGPGLVNRLRFAKLDAAVVAKFFADEHDGADYADRLRDVIARENAEALETMSLAVHFMRDRSRDEIVRHWDVLRHFAEQFTAAEARFARELDLLQARHGLEPA